MSRYSCLHLFFSDLQESSRFLFSDMENIPLPNLYKKIFTFSVTHIIPATLMKSIPPSAELLRFHDNQNSRSRGNPPFPNCNVVKIHFFTKQDGSFQAYLTERCIIEIILLLNG